MSEDARPDIAERLLDDEWRGPHQHLRGWDELDALHDDAAAEIERLRDAQAWRPIETAPRDGSEIILGGRHCGVGAGFYAAGGDYRRGADGWWWEMDRGDLLTAKNANPTHWRPLPDAPA